MLMGLLFAASLVILLRFIRPEQLMKVESLPDLTDFFATLQSPITPMLPSFWAGEALFASLRGGVDWLHFAALWTTALAAVVLRMANERWYFTGYSRAQESPKARFTQLRQLEAIVRLLPLSTVRRQLLIKDLKIFLRELEAAQRVGASVDRRVGEDAGGLLEGGRGQPRLGRERGLGDAHELRTTRGRLAALGDHAPVLLLEPHAVHEVGGQQVGVTRLEHRDPAQHLPHDDLDVLVVDRHALRAVDRLHLVDQVLLGLADTEDAQDLLGVRRTDDQLVADLDVVAVGRPGGGSAG